MKSSFSSSTSPILVVEDEAIVAADIESRLQRMGYKTLGPAASGAEALAFARETRPLLAIMDIHLQGEMDGIELANLLRTELDVPVIFLTAHADEATLERAQVSESFGYLLKPFEERMLQITVGMAIYKHGMEQERKQLALELHESKAQIRTLEGLLSTCAFCKRIEDDHGLWTPIETYISRHFGANFSHTYCPDCMRREFPDFAEEVLEKMKAQEK